MQNALKEELLKILEGFSETELQQLAPHATTLAQRLKEEANELLGPVKKCHLFLTTQLPFTISGIDFENLESTEFIRRVWSKTARSPKVEKGKEIELLFVQPRREFAEDHWDMDKIVPDTFAPAPDGLIPTVAQGVHELLPEPKAPIVFSSSFRLTQERDNHQPGDYCICLFPGNAPGTYKVDLVPTGMDGSSTPQSQPYKFIQVYYRVPKFA